MFKKILQKNRSHFFILSALLLALGCGTSKTRLLESSAPAQLDFGLILRSEKQKISFNNEVQPILNRRCVVCHGCYDAPCQLKLSSYEGLKRGTSQESVYNGSRLNPIDPSRLFIDQKSTKQWRNRGFNSVVADQAKPSAIQNLERSVLYKSIRQKQLHPQARTGPVHHDFEFDLYRENVCATIDKYEEMADEHPSWGMPFGLPNLSDQEYATITMWIAQGAQSDEKIPKINKVTKHSIDTVEQYLNAKTRKQQLISRYIYEHLFLAHIHFKKTHSREFYRLVRSRTAIGPIDEIATVRPYDSPGEVPFFYRFRHVKSSIVVKNHLVYEISQAKLKRWKTLFNQGEFSVYTLPSYEAKDASNPFKTFSQIPAKIRYKFLLDNHKFFIESFIKGPVCRGQIALNVIDDQFWTFFVDPEKDFSSNNLSLHKIMENELALPAEHKSSIKVLSIYTDYWKAQQKYQASKRPYVRQMHSKGTLSALSHLKQGANASLTIFRHSDSASVRKGLWGHTPKTAWVIDYPLLERIHYLLVAGFNVYGGVGHQLNTRLYMDFLRMEGENNFLAYLPIRDRTALRNTWDNGLRASLIQEFSNPTIWREIESSVQFKTANTYIEMLSFLKKRVFSPLEATDRINQPLMSLQSDKASDPSTKNIFEKLKKISTAKGTQLLKLPEVTFLRVRRKNAQDLAFSLLRNKTYQNLKFFLSDENNRSKLDINSDTLSIVEGLEGSYPNLFLTIDETEIDRFTNDFTNLHLDDAFQFFLARYGIQKTSSQFWQTSDWFFEKSMKLYPLRAGIFDLSRYRK